MTFINEELRIGRNTASEKRRRPEQSRREKRESQILQINTNFIAPCFSSEMQKCLNKLELEELN
jgi:hypothetical protein